MAASVSTAPTGAYGRIRRFMATPRFARIFSIILFFLAWQFVVPFLPTDLIPSPAKVLGFMWDELLGNTLGRTTVWEAFGISLVLCQASEPVYCLVHYLAISHSNKVALQLEDLLDVGPVQVVSQVTTHGDCATLDSAVSLFQRSTCAQVLLRWAEP